MSDLIRINANNGNIPQINDSGKVGGSGDLIDERSNAIQEKLASQENFENLRTDRRPSSTVGKVLSSIGHGIMHAAGVTANFGASVLSKVANSIANSFIGRFFGLSENRNSAEAFIQGQNANNAAAPKDNAEINIINAEINQLGKFELQNDNFEMLKAHSNYARISHEIKSEDDYDAIEKVPDEKNSDSTETSNDGVGKKEVTGKAVANNENVSKNENLVDFDIKDIAEHDFENIENYDGNFGDVKDYGDDDLDDLNEFSNNDAKNNEVIKEKTESNSQNGDVNNVKNKAEKPAEEKTEADQMTMVAKHLSEIYKNDKDELNQLGTAIRQSKDDLAKMFHVLYDPNAEFKKLNKTNVHSFIFNVLDVVGSFRDNCLNVDKTTSVINFDEGILSPLEQAEDVYKLRSGLNLLIKELQTEIDNKKAGGPLTDKDQKELENAQSLLSNLTDPEIIRFTIASLQDELDALKADFDLWVAEGKPKNIEGFGNRYETLMTDFINCLSILKSALETDVDVLNMK